MQLFHYNSEYPDYETASNNTDGLAAVSFFYEISAADNGAMDPLLTNIGALEKKILNPLVEEDMYDVPVAEVDTLEVLLPSDGLQLWDNYFYYSGSETLPNNETDFIGPRDCTEPVLWIVYEKTIPISEAQMNPLRRLLLAVNNALKVDPPCVHNFRPVHQLDSATTNDGVLVATGRQLFQSGRMFFFFNLLRCSFFNPTSPKAILPPQANCLCQEFCSIESFLLSCWTLWKVPSLFYQLQHVIYTF